jgi:hypothetical protein
MATNTSWGFGEWNAYNWGGLGQDVTVLVGAEDGWGRSTWGSGYYGTIVPDVTLQLQTNVGTALVSLPIIIDVSGASAQVSIGTGYTATGASLTNLGSTVAQNISFVDFSDVTFSTATITASAALIYNTTNSGKAVVVLDFGGDKTSTNGDFTIQFPAANSTSAIIRIS